MGLRTLLGLKKPRTIAKLAGAGPAKAQTEHVDPARFERRKADNINYPATVRANTQPVTLQAISTFGCKDVAEFGILDGGTSLEIARVIAPRGGTLHIFDFQHNVDMAIARLAEAGLTNVVGYGSSSKLLDSYNWPLSKLLEQHTSPIFDYAFIDGAHTWSVDALTFLLVDRLLKVGGYADFDDYHWTLAGSQNLAPEKFPLTAELYTEEQIADKQVKRLVDLLVKRDPRYTEVHRNKIYRKIA